jgi:1-acyl-sn-glycerol-3-phosphate acyltransferase
MTRDAEVPARSARLFDWFAWYSVRYLRKHFHAVRLSKAGGRPPAGGPLLVVMNHPSWWDAMIGFPILPYFPPAEHYAAIDAMAVQKYRFFTKLGFFGVDTTSFRGAADFLRTGGAILSAPNRAVWVTAQGQFADARVRPLGLRSGVGHLAARMAGGAVLPIAVEYPFWGERTPEALLRFGEPLAVGGAGSGKEWTARIEAALTDAMDELAADARSRDPARFETLVGGTAGVGGPYDLWRRGLAWATGRRFDPTHTGESS